MKVEQQKDSKQKKIVQIEDLSVSFDGMEVVKHVNIEVNSGEIVGIVGTPASLLSRIHTDFLSASGGLFLYIMQLKRGYICNL